MNESSERLIESVDCLIVLSSLNRLICGHIVPMSLICMLVDLQPATKDCHSVTVRGAYEPMRIEVGWLQHLSHDVLQVKKQLIG
jgi:hypothetical protein